jgi:peptide/nickel transport system permease protein
MKRLIYRLISSIVLVFVVSALTFLLMSLLPTDAARVILGTSATPASYEKLRAQLGLNEPLYLQYWNYITAAFHGNLGTSIFTGEPVEQSLLQRLPVTLSLLVPSIILCTIVGVALGIASSATKGVVRRAIDVLSLVGSSLPGFWLALVLVTVFAVAVPLFPATGYIPFAQDPGGWTSSLVLPVIALSVAGIAGIAKITRDGMLETLSQDYIRTLQAAGVSRTRIIFKHALRNASIPVSTVVGLVFIGSLSGSIFVENVFVLPGLGSLAVTATSQSDIPVIQGVALVFTLIVIVINILVDLSYIALNPKGRTR